ncbi:Protein CBG05803 [Caenorhabditis briggsae]|uniref:Uncharacterized protein n=2 Tax=Caenorhabditis briggsae TaxID=6238 RepID=A0AAE9D4J8_CAEBR|nr:Protein CBG05803 [Caenorhabditis briggsae]ULT95009.1 hypothetical protein L3Y34_004037 [Caenorhabditis briggsae]UMM28219.1 hypothetical protein L5515_011157 [Caenorhabditis briggsae]CAP26521.1 Protein CBG05803 [Caenorhabditis briggsae]
MMRYLLPLALLIGSANAFRGLPSLPGYLTAFGSSAGTSSEEQGNGRFYSRGLRVKTYPRTYNGLESLTEPKEKDPVLAQIRQNVQLDIQKISDEVGLVSRQISAIYNNHTISNEERNNAIQLLTEKHPKIVPAVLNLIGKLHKINTNNYNTARYNRF